MDQAQLSLRRQEQLLGLLLASIFHSNVLHIISLDIWLKKIPANKNTSLLLQNIW